MVEIEKKTDIQKTKKKAEILEIRERKRPVQNKRLEVVRINRKREYMTSHVRTDLGFNSF